MRRWTRVAVTMVSTVVPVLVFTGTADAATTAALWHMQDPVRMLDSSGNGNNGATTAVTGVPGTSGRGYHFNGRTSIVTVPDAASLNPGTANLKVTARLRFTVVPSGSVADYDIVRKGMAGTTGGEWKMEIFPPSSGSPSGTAYCLFQDVKGTKAGVRDTRNLADGAWHTVSCVKTATAVKVIVDGVTRSAPARLGSISNTKPLTVGAKAGGGDQYLGDLDEVSIQIG